MVNIPLFCQHSQIIRRNWQENPSNSVITVKKFCGYLAEPYLETAGARMYKYSYDLNSKKDGKLIDNDIVLFRYADVLLMRAECKLRIGEDGSGDFNAVRERSYAEPRKCTLDNILDERLLELCWEGWRRPDLIRFNRYKSLYEGPGAIDESDGHTKVFPIPAEVRALNKNLTQNPGY